MTTTVSSLGEIPDALSDRALSRSAVVELRETIGVLAGGDTTVWTRSTDAVDRVAVLTDDLTVRILMRTTGWKWRGPYTPDEPRVWLIDRGYTAVGYRHASPDLPIVPLQESHHEQAKQLWRDRFGALEDAADEWLDDSRPDADPVTRGFAAIDDETDTLAGFGIASVASPDYARDYVFADELGLDIDPWASTGILHILLVAEDYEGQGLGTALVERRLRWLEAATSASGVIGLAWHRDDHHDSRRLFDRFGFEPVATVDEFYALHEGEVPCVDCEGSCRCDATIYRRSLDGGVLDGE